MVTGVLYSLWGGVTMFGRKMTVECELSGFNPDNSNLSGFNPDNTGKGLITFVVVVVVLTGGIFALIM